MLSSCSYLRLAARLVSPPEPQSSGALVLVFCPGSTPPFTGWEQQFIYQSVVLFLTTSISPQGIFSPRPDHPQSKSPQDSRILLSTAVSSSDFQQPLRLIYKY
ncbi:unnamed protein product [Orchesella dallaii]|uniref:Uncharacterized protein n=1 Tax=Orchesella dallaii TaxID=48710 RepID=A0ABP1RH69_9HEXA